MSETYEALLEATVDVAAPPSAVWEVVSDPTRLAGFSPQVVRTLVLGGPARRGSRMVNLNRQGWKHWPTTATVVRFDPEREFAFRVSENRVVWSFTLEGLPDGGTRLVERRETPEGISSVSMVLVHRMLGGQGRFTTELRRGMETTLAGIKAAAESGAGTAG